MRGMLDMSFLSYPKAINIDEIYICSNPLNYSQIDLQCEFGKLATVSCGLTQITCDISCSDEYLPNKYVSMDSPLLISADEPQSKYKSHQCLMWKTST